MADLLEVKGESVYKIRAYRRAAEQLEQLPEELGEVVRSGEIDRVPGFGKALAAKAREFVATGQVADHQALLSEYPAEVRELLRVPGVGPKLADRLFREAGVASLEALEAAAREGRLRGLRGFGPRAEERMLAGIEALRPPEGRRGIGEVLPQARWLAAQLEALPQVERVAIAGSLRRWKEEVKDADLVVASGDAEGLVAALRERGLAQEVGGGTARVPLVLPTGLKVDLRVVAPIHFASALHHFTGSKEHHLLLRERARRLGLSISEYGIAQGDGPPEPVASEEALYQRLGLAWIPPELREGQEELELAEQGALPRLVTLEDLRGDLHIHTDWSDGRASLEAMVEAARARGYAYVAICDHSPAVRVAGGLEPDRLLAQVDFVVASIHSHMSQDPETLLERYRKALASPWVDCIGHPTGRLLGRREAMAVPVEALVELAAERGVALEINASPERLDLDSRWARLAARAGVPLAINTDAHHPDHLAFAEYGVGVARRAGLTADQVINAWPPERLLAWIRSRRDRARRR